MNSSTLRTLVDVLAYARDTYGDRRALAAKAQDGWHWKTYDEVAALVDRFRAGLAKLGVGAGDRVAIISNNSVEWAVACYATYGRGAAFVPMYEAQHPHEWQFILGDCEAKVVITATEQIQRKVSAFRGELPRLERVVRVDAPASDPDSFAALVEAGTEDPVPVVDPDPESIAGYIYTSGTTGDPKGGLLTHRNIVSNLLAVREVFPLEPGERSLSFLPWAHLFGQTCELHYGMISALEIAINDAIPHLLDNLKEVRPTILVAVPRIFNRIYKTVHKQIAGEAAVVRRLFDDGIAAASRRAAGKRIGLVRKLELAIDDRLIFSKVRERFGGRLKFAISGSAALSPEVAQFIDTLGIAVYEGYGLSETSPIVSANTPTARKIGSVGKPLPGVRVEIDRSVTGDDREGEIIVYGPNVMKGYHNSPEENAEVFTEDDGLRTGDLGYLDDEGFLYVTGRIKEQYKLETGKYVMPSPLEEILKLSPYVASVMLFGENKPYNVALVVPERSAVEAWARAEGRRIVDLGGDRAVYELLEREIAVRAQGFKSYERPRKIAVIDEEFTVENELLTPTLKLKRRNIVMRYWEVLESLYRVDEERRVAASG